MARVLIFYQYYCTPRGAWGTRYYEFTRRWAAAGHAVTVVTSIYDKSDLEPTGFVTEFRIEGVTIIAMNLRLSNKHGTLRRLWTFLQFSLLSVRYALTLPCDIVVASSGPITVGVPGLLAHWLRRKPLIFEVRDLWPEGAIQLGMLKNGIAQRIARAFERLCYRNSTTVVALSPGMAEGVRRVAPGARVAMIPNSADLDLFRPDVEIPESMRARHAGKLVVLYAGTLGRANSSIELVEIATELARRGASDVRIVVVGDGFERAGMERLALERGLANIDFIGVRPKTEVAQWHALADLTLCLFKPFPVLATCSPNKLFDSLAAGKPVVNNTDGWIRELLDRSGAGLSYAANDARAAAEAILALRHDPARRAAMGDRARRVAESEFARDRLAAEFEQLFRT
ncbi:MAG: glycosyltransferase family 4 protein [Candidatus Eisenbacteria bacterium]|uniref:Glycosyltransferase family 4 protein n=1 Tax=Eiseniibacteriota bacterium TaxID=2212470 RepID=A0A849STT4_UNCEI|nr:glycosyltransferase family 4 protein [Candidatus Eisenbacteria bacterium]